MEGLLTLIFVLNGICMMLALFQVVRGPSLPDRVVALELLTTVTVGFVALISVATEQAHLLDVALALALLGFLVNVAFARFLEDRGGTGD